MSEPPRKPAAMFPAERGSWWAAALAGSVALHGAGFALAFDLIPWDGWRSPPEPDFAEITVASLILPEASPAPEAEITPEPEITPSPAPEPEPEPAPEPDPAPEVLPEPPAQEAVAPEAVPPETTAPDPPVEPVAAEPAEPEPAPPAPEPIPEPPLPEPVVPETVAPEPVAPEPAPEAVAPPPEVTENPLLAEEGAAGAGIGPGVGAAAPAVAPEPVPAPEPEPVAAPEPQPQPEPAPPVLAPQPQPAPSSSAPRILAEPLVPPPPPPANAGAVQRLVERIRAELGDSCLVALPQNGEGSAPRVVLVSDRDRSMMEFAEAVLPDPQAPEAPPFGQRAVLVDPRQCPAVNFLRARGEYPAFGLSLGLVSPEVMSGGRLIGSIEGVSPGAYTALLLVDDNGVVQDLRRFIRFSGGKAEFDVPVTRDGDPRDTSQILIALAAPARPATITNLAGRLAEDFFPALAKDLPANASLAVLPFDLR